MLLPSLVAQGLPTFAHRAPPDSKGYSGDVKAMHHATPTPRRAETLDYMQGMLGQLRVMAEREQCYMLAYLIEMACMEVSDVIRADQLSSIAHKKRNLSA